MSWQDMPDLLALVLLMLVLFAVVFIFQGERDLWDVAHAAAMRYFDGGCKP